MAEASEEHSDEIDKVKYAENSKEDGEIPGRLASDLDKNEPPFHPVVNEGEGSSKTADFVQAKGNASIVCDLCKEDDKSLPAEGYCVNCNDFLCIDCFQNHRKPKPLRHHVLQDKDSMPQSKGSQNVKERYERQCRVHQNETALYYCTTHDNILCELCKQFDHRQCQKQGQLKDINEISLNPEHIDAIQRQMAALEKELVNNKDIALKTGNNITSSYARVIKEITRIKDADLQMTQDVIAACENILLQIASQRNKMMKLSEMDDKIPLYLALKNYEGDIKTFENDLTKVKCDNKTFEYRFLTAEHKRNQNYKKVGTVIKCPLLTDSIHVKTETDTETCYISGITKLSEYTYVLADYKNLKIKVFDLRSKSITSELKLDITPHSITQIDETTVAVSTFNHGKILKISVSDSITVQRTFTKGKYGTCSCVLFCNDELFVSHDTPDTIEVLTVDGALKSTISGECANGDVRFGDVGGLAEGIDSNTLYISDITDNELKCMTLGGEIKSSFTHKYLKSPRGITYSSDGMVFLCCKDSHTILRISSDLSEGQVILGQENGIYEPFSVAFSDETQQLLVSSYGKNVIQIFQL